MVEVIECDPSQLLVRAGRWLAAEPILHNVVCTVIRRAASRVGDQPGSCRNGLTTVRSP